MAQHCFKRSFHALSGHVFVCMYACIYACMYIPRDHLSSSFVTWKFAKPLKEIVSVVELCICERTGGFSLMLVEVM